jgi:hypothetical protein
MPTVAYYAMGGGLGHLVRARAVLHTLGLEADGHVLSASAHVRDPRVSGPLCAEVPPPDCGGNAEALADWLERTLHRLAPDLLFVDVFPGGVLGEISRPLWPVKTRLCYVGRLLRWPAYARRLRAPLPRFDITYLVEPLHDDHALAVRAASTETKELQLTDPPLPAPPPLAENTWVVLHSGPPEELRQLVAYAQDIQCSEGISAPIQVVGPTATSGILPCFPAAGYFALAARVVTACGFNVMRQSAGAQARHHFLPLPRPLDDQYVRAARRRLLSAGFGESSSPTPRDR